MRRRQALTLASFSTLNALLGCAVPLHEPVRWLALPAVNTATPLRVVYAHNPRFARPPDGFVTQVLQRAQTLSRAHLGLIVNFGTPREAPISTLFDGLSPSVWETLKGEVYDVKAGTGDRNRLIKTTAQHLARNRSTLAAQIEFAKPHLVSSTAPTDVASLAEALVDTQLNRFTAWLKLRGSDGQALIDGGFYNEYLAWIQAASSWAYEVVITNQLIASVEYADNTTHSALRGGVTNGVTVQARFSRYGTASVVSLFPMLSQDGLTRQLRGDFEGQTTNAVEAAAAMLVHELGHQLLHLGHPFGHSACIMSPPELLRFDAWTRQLNGMQCPLGNHPENKPGAVKFDAVI